MNLKDFNKIYFNNVPNSVADKAIDEYVKGFRADRNKKMLKDKLFLGMTYEEIAEKYDMSVRQVKTIISNSAQMIVTHLGVEI